jgi:3-hydroxybutyrate dehydrogenase
MSLKGKCAVVTGSTSGIGLGIAQALAAQGANIVMNGFGPADEIEKLRAGIETTHGVKAIYNGADMTRPAEIAALIDAAVKAFGGIGVLVNNAGIQHVAAIEDFPEDKWNAIIAINLSAAFHGTKFAIPHMRKAKWGRIINIASAHGLVASPQKVAYVAAKHGIVGLTKVAGIELANSGVTCNAICPGWVLTPLVQKQIEDRAKQTNTTVEQQTIALVSEKQPSHKFSTPEQIGGLAVFLCSSAADNITGTEIAIDGGWTAQ